MFQHTFGTHPEQPLPTGYEGISFIVGELGIAPGCVLGIIVTRPPQVLQHRAEQPCCRCRSMSWHGVDG